MSESQRLQTLSTYRILDSKSEKSFDDLVQLAGRICDTPMAAIALTTTRRHWFKAKLGLSINEVARELTFCDQVVRDGVSLIVKDLTSDARFAQHPFVTGEPRIRFYAGYPLHSSDGQVLGTFCVMDTRPRQLDDQQTRALDALARQTTVQLDLRRIQILLDEEFPDATNILATVGHELRTPLQGVIGSLEMLMETQLTTEQWEFVQVAQRSSENLLRVVMQVLAVSQEANLGNHRGALRAK